MEEANTLHHTKKRAAGREISKDNPGLDDEDVIEHDLGTFKRASDEVIARRRMANVRRQPDSSAPYAGIHLVPPIKTEMQVDVEKAADVKEKEYTPSKGSGEDNRLDDKDLTEMTDESAHKEKADCVNKTAEEQTSLEGNEDKQRIVKEDHQAMLSDKTSLETSTEERNDRGIADCPDKPNDDGAVIGDEKEDDKKPDVYAEATTPISSFQQLSSGKNAFTALAGSGFSFGSVLKEGSPPSFGFGTSKDRSTQVFSSASLKRVLVENREEDDDEAALHEFSKGDWREDSSASQASGSESSASQESGSESSASQKSGPKSSAPQESGSKPPASQESGSKSAASQESGSKSPDSQESGLKSSASQESGSKYPDSQESGLKSLASQESGSESSVCQKLGSKSSDSQEAGSESSE